MQSQFPRLSTLFCLIILWVVSCKTAEPVVPKSAEKVIAGFAFNSLTPAVTATVDGAAKTIMATVPFGTDVTKLVPTIAVSTKATVFPASGVAQDFTKSVTYTVTAEDGTTQAYAVAVGVGAAPKSMAKDITAFSFSGLSPVVNCAIDGTTKMISATLPAGTDATKLIPTITLSAKATVSPATGVAQDFTKAVVYTVTAEDGTKQAYTATIVAPAAPIVTTKTIKSNSDLPDVLEDLGDGVDYLVTANIPINGTRVVTVKPGVKIQFEGGSSGFSVNSQAALKMIGTAAKPIILEGKVASAGSWQGVYMQANNLENQWEYVTLRHAGGTTDQRSGLKIDGYNSERISLKNCTFSDNTGYGVEVSDTYYGNSRFVAFESNTFTNNTKSAVRICQQQLGSLDSKSSYANNGQKYIEVSVKGSPSTDDLVVQKLDVPYRVLGLIEPRAKTTINPGVQMEFTSDAGFLVGESYKNAAFIANGTAANPIRFSGYIANTKGVWAGINVQSVSVETIFNYCIIDGAGSSAEPFFCVPKTSRVALMLGREYNCNPIDSRGAITNCTISNSGGYGIAYRTADPTTVSGNTYSGNTKDNVYNFK